MSAWGKTGRVEVVEYGEELLVFGDSARAGEVTLVKHGASRGKWFGAVGSMSTPPRKFAWSPDLPSLDHAVMWVLRRAAPDAWRAERGPVWRVTGSGLTVRGLHWRATVPQGDMAYLVETWREAMDRTAITESKAATS